MEARGIAPCDCSTTPVAAYTGHRRNFAFSLPAPSSFFYHEWHESHECFPVEKELNCAHFQARFMSFVHSCIRERCQEMNLTREWWVERAKPPAPPYTISVPR